MRNKIVLGIFLAGILLTGIGAGIAFGEYSQFTYGGEVILGTEKSEVETMEYVIPLSDNKIRVNNYTTKPLDLVEDKQLKDGQVRVEVIANPDYVRSFMEYVDYDTNEFFDYDPNYISGYDGQIEIHTGRVINEFEFVMKCKDDFLQNLKNSVIKNYYLDAVKSVTVKANAKTLEHLEY
ncbi:MAG: hypothetical protein E7253_03960 [Lachnospiraceae bacterium]|nr:hypothetical protein [Lachnospiraceae bacterium]